MKACLFHPAPTSAELLSTPFQCCCLPNFVSTGAGSGTSSNETLGTGIQGDHFLHGLVSELLKLKFYEKNNDLYQFRQVRSGDPLPVQTGMCDSSAVDKAVPGEIPPVAPMVAPGNS